MADPKLSDHKGPTSNEITRGGVTVNTAYDDVGQYEMKLLVWVDGEFAGSKGYIPGHDSKPKTVYEILKGYDEGKFERFAKRYTSK